MTEWFLSHGFWSEFPWTYFICEVSIGVVQDGSPEVFFPSNIQASYPTTSQQEQSHSVSKACAGV